MTHEEFSALAKEYGFERVYFLAPECFDLGENPYGCADAANILYTVGRFPGDARERQASAAAWPMPVEQPVMRMVCMGQLPGR